MKKIASLVFLFIFAQVFAQESLKVKLNDSSQLRLSGLKINVSIVGNFAKTTYDMRFYNELDRTLEGELVFPLAEGQAVSQFAMDVNGKLRDAVIVEKELARVAFENTVRQTIDPGLLEKTEGNNYKARVYPILPKEYKHIVLTFEQELAAFNQHHTYELPLSLDEELENFSIRLQAFNGESLPKIKSANYKNFVFKEGNGVFTASIELRNHKPSSPVIVELPNSNNEANSLSYKDYFYLNKKLKPNTRLKQKPGKITLLWDTSYSLANRNLDKELSILDAYFEYLRAVEVHFIAFSNSVHQNTVYRILDGNWEELKKVLLETKYDGGTSLNLFKSLSKSDEILLFTDGLANLGDFPTANKQVVYTINSSIAANHESLNTIATSSGGNYVNLVRLPQIEALNALKEETFQFLGTVSNSAIHEVYPRTKTNVYGDFSISGRFSEETTIELLFGYQGKVTERVKAPIRKTSENELIKRLWAKQKLKHLNAHKKSNKEQIISLAKTHHLITDYTSMLILDRIEDYVRYRIEPPQELRAEYKERIRDLKSAEAEKQEDLNDRKEYLFDDYETLLDWYNTTYPKEKTRPSKNETSNTQNTGRSSGAVHTTNNTSSSTRTNIAIDSTRGMVSGTVLDSNNVPLPGANVVVKGTTNGTTTDFDGNFVIHAEKEDELVISYLGYSSSNVVIGESNSISISLEEDTSSLNEVVVVGHGVQRVQQMTASVTSVAQSLQGRAAGVQVTQNSGVPGDGTTVTVRGANSISGESNALYIVDGVPANANGIQEINPEDIEDIQMLKAMNASALYGSRGANGIIIITTKKGLESNTEAIAELDRKIAEKIELKAWNPNTPYIKILEKERTVESAYKKYFEIRNDYSNSPSFYLDVSDFFDKKGKSNIAITILTNLMEIELNNHEIMKALAYKLEYFKQYGLASIVYKKVLELRPEEPQSYRDLALAYECDGKIQESFDILHKIYSGELLEKDEEERFMVLSK
ncbi:carboxypeptidase-like regulatory domain-containing protein [Muricauda sp. SCSIO 64092]|uniref:VIT domain-containing protein n=1 Tax=Allomuricauda sp. SCSIO 64092 TaxID=2908842 RepID=UPI001FF18368|nr:VIT domain-containing protein [Muricauda sp. SCSIO 64092]UOY08931.1 carboxypeptidase-like regulatory domain-containing protein [Muricauda sp. SCSIO 64092]